MDFFEIVKSRRSIRAYKSDPVAREDLENILQAANLAPTACDYQPFRVFVMPTKGREAELLKVYAKEWLVKAPYVILICSLASQAWSRSDGKNYADVDATIAFDHLILAANALGLGTCWIAAFNPGEVRRVFALPAGYEPVALTPVGYPAEAPAARKRKNLEDFVTWLPTSE